MKKEDKESNESLEDRISLEATEWISKRDEGFSAEDQDAFFEWLAEDPRHKTMYNKRLGLWDEMNLLEDWRPRHSAEPNPDLLATRPTALRKNRLVAAGTVAALFLFVTFAVYQWVQRDKAETLMLAFGGAEDYENHVLEDGSVVELNLGAQVSVQFDINERMVFLHTGEAHFTVAKDAVRPFLVRAGDALVRATGTAFNVSHRENGIEVLVTEGSVQLRSSVTPTTEDTDGLIVGDPWELVAGQRSLVPKAENVDEVSVELVTFEEIDRQLSWKGEVLDFDAVPLIEVANAFNSLNRTKILIVDEDLKQLKITAKLRSSNFDQFAELLEITENIQAYRNEESNIILSREITNTSH